MTYAEKLRDPRWQKMRLKVLERDGFRCKQCGDDKKTLHVHHEEYWSGRDPWDYPMRLLTTMCEPCHEEFRDDDTGERTRVENTLIGALRDREYAAGDVLTLAAAIHFTELPCEQWAVMNAVEDALRYHCVAFVRIFYTVGPGRLHTNAELILRQLEEYERRESAEVENAS